MRSLPFLLIACLTLLFMAGEADARSSPVFLSSDLTYSNVLEDDMVVTTLTINNTDTEYRTQEVYLDVYWPSNVSWNISFKDINENIIEGNEIGILSGGVATIKFYVFCDDPCQAGDENTAVIYASTDPRFYNNDGNVTDTCGSDDCETDTTPANQSANVTNSISIKFIARTASTSSLSCDTVSSAGDNQLSQNITSLWNYTLTNTGWNTDKYDFNISIISENGHDVSLWTVSSGLSNGKELTGAVNQSFSAVSVAESSMQLTPALSASPGTYSVELTVISNNGGQNSSCAFNVVIPVEEEPDDEPEEEVVEDEPEDESKEVVEDEEIPEEVPSISLVSSIAAIGIIALRRRY